MLMEAASRAEFIPTFRHSNIFGLHLNKLILYQLFPCLRASSRASTNERTCKSSVYLVEDVGNFDQRLVREIPECRHTEREKKREKQNEMVRKKNSFPLEFNWKQQVTSRVGLKHTKNELVAVRLRKRGNFLFIRRDPI